MYIYSRFRTIDLNISISSRFLYFGGISTSMCGISMCFCSIPIFSFGCCNMNCRIAGMSIKFCLVGFFTNCLIQCLFYIFILLNSSGNFFQSIHCLRSTTDKICNFLIRVFISICICSINSSLLSCRYRLTCITGIIYVSQSDF